MSDQSHGLFDYVKDLTHNKKMIKTSDPNFEKSYNPFMIGRALSFNVSDVMWANILNMYHDSMTKTMHHDFLFHGLNASSRRGRWIKDSPKDVDVQLVSEYYHISLRESESMIDLISSDELEKIRVAKGGKMKR